MTGGDKNRERKKDMEIYTKKYKDIYKKKKSDEKYADKSKDTHTNEDTYRNSAK